MFVFGKIKSYIIGALALALPIIYVMGQVKGRAKEKTKVLEDELKAQTKASDFYKNMGNKQMQKCHGHHHFVVYDRYT